jgi:hypothetical protein
MRIRFHPSWRLAAAAAVAAWVGPVSVAQAVEPAFKDLIVRGADYPSAANHLCYSSDGTVEVACPATSPYISSGGLLGIGTENPAYPLDVSGTVRASQFIGDGSGLTGVVASTGDRIVSGSTSLMAFQSTGLISITQAGVNTAYFHPNLGLVTIGISSTGGISGTRVYSSGVAVAEQGFFSNNNSSFGWGSGSQTAIVGTAISKYIAFNTSGTEAMRIVSSGFVGIGTSAPSKPLHVIGNSLTEAGIMLGASTGDNRLSFAPSGNASAIMQLYQTNGTFALENSAGNYIITAQGSGQRVGIGGVPATSTSTTLHVSGTIRMADGGEACDANRTGAIKYSGGDFAICRNGSAWESLSAVAAGAVSVTDGLSGSLVFRDQLGGLHGHPTISVSSTTGSVGIGAAAPAGMSSGVYAVGSIYSSQGLGTGTAGMFYFNAGAAKITGDGQNGGNNYLAFAISNTEAMRIVSSGFVGIGTSAPGVLFDISGSGTVLRAGNGKKSFNISMIGSDVDITAVDKSLYIMNGATSSTLINPTGAGNILLGGSSNKVGVGLGVVSSLSATLHVSGTARISSWTMIGANTTPTTALDVSGSIKASGSIQVSGTGGETCGGAEDLGRIRVNPATGRLQLCAPS